MYFFDLDGTILDSNGAWAQLDSDFLGRYGIREVPPDYSDFVAHHSFPEAAAYTRTRFSIPLSDQEIMAVWTDMARQAYAADLPLKPHVTDFLRRARQAGVRCALATSCLPDLCRLALDHHRLAGFFEQVFTTSQVGLDKRDPRFFLQVAQQCGCPPEDCVLFDDSPVSCAAANQAGWRVYGVSDPLFHSRSKEMLTACSTGFFPFSFQSALP